MSRQTIITRKLVLNNTDRKPSVFERLGTKSNVVSHKSVCQNWAQNGTCPYNKHCKLAQSHTMISTSKRFKFDTMKKANLVHKKCKDLHKKTMHSHGSDLEWEGWELADLEDADEKVLEKRKQELQRELQLQLKKEKELIRKKEKRVDKKRAPSTSSSSTTTDTSSSSSSTSSSSSEPRKCLSRKRKHSSSSSESGRSLHRQKKAVKTAKTKVTGLRKQVEKKNYKLDDIKSKSSVSKKTVAQKKSYSPNWEKSRGRSQSKQQITKKSPHQSPDIASKNKSSSPRYDKISLKNKGRGYSPKAKSKEPSPKKGAKKTKEFNIHGKDKVRQSSPKPISSPSKSRKVSPLRSRRHELSSEKRRGHHEEPKHILRKDRSREKDRKRDFVRGRSNENDSNGGLKKGGKILPLKPPNYNKNNGNKKETTCHKSSDKNSNDSKTKDNSEKERNRIDHEKEREKYKCERDKNRRKKNGDGERERRSAREKDTGKNNIRNRDERCRDRESERSRLTKEKDSERQKEREEGSERSRERQKERDGLDKEKKEKEDKKYLREDTDIKGNRDRELLPVFDLKSESPTKSGADINSFKSSEKLLPRENHRSSERGNEKCATQERDGRDKCSPLDRDHDRRDQTRKLGGEGDKDHESKRNRENGELRSATGEIRRNFVEGRRGVDDGRQWEDVWRPSSDAYHERRRTLEVTNGERRQLPTNRRPLEDSSYRRHPRGENDTDLRDFATDDRRGGSRKSIQERPEWSVKDENNDYRSSEVADEWKNRSERHHDWNSRCDLKWMNKEETRDEGWSHYSRRGQRDGWNGDWLQDTSRQVYTESERCQSHIEGAFSDYSGKRRNGSEPIISPEGFNGKETTMTERPEHVFATGQTTEKLQKEEDALSDISDDPDDILNQDDYPVEEIPSGRLTENSNQQVYVRNNEYFYEQRRPLFECLGERSLDFEEISDEELEEEARIGKGIVDVLGADWAGLLQETRPKANKVEGSGSAHRRWTTEKLISAMGISFKYAGETFFHKFMDELRTCKYEVSTPDQDCQKEVQEFRKMKSEEKGPSKKIGTTEFLEDNKSEEKEEIIPQIFHKVPSLHSILKEDRCLKSILFSSHNRFKRALSARTDLALRRQLCNLPSTEPLHFTPPLDKKMFEISIQQFQNGQTTAAV